MSILVNSNIQPPVAEKLSEIASNLKKSNENMASKNVGDDSKNDLAGTYDDKKLESQLSKLEKYQTNVAYAMNVLSVTDEALSNIQDDIVHIKGMSMQAAKKAYPAEAKAAISQDIDNRINNINDIAENTYFNGTQIFNSNGLGMKDAGLAVETGTESIKVNNNVFENADNNALGMNWKANVSISNPGQAEAFAEKCDKALNNIIARRSEIGKNQKALEKASDGISTSIENVSAAQSTIMDTDMASNVANDTKQQILNQITTSVLTQANQVPTNISRFL